MLVLSRKTGEQILLDGEIEITVCEIDGGRVKIGIKAPQSVGILRTEIARLESQPVNRCKGRMPRKGKRYA